MKILFVENHAVFARVVTDNFLQEHQVTIATCVAEAIKAFNTKEYDVTLVDYDLDDGKGAELVQAIRIRGMPVKVVGVSAHELGNSEMLRVGADAICGKMQFEKITEVLDTL